LDLDLLKKDLDDFDKEAPLGEKEMTPFCPLDIRNSDRDMCPYIKDFLATTTGESDLDLFFIVKLPGLGDFITGADCILSSRVRA
jgi:hypothetical protein